MRNDYLLDTVILCIFSITYAAQSSSKDLMLLDSCETPNNEKGICLKVRDCQSAIDVLMKGNITRTVKNYLRLSQCRFSGTDVVICCANVTIPGNRIFDVHDCVPKVENRIYGGSAAQIGEFPWMALISYKKPFDKHGFHCVANLISSRYLLTAAHCVLKMPPEWQIESVRLGEYSLSNETDCMTINQETVCAPPVINMPIVGIIVHENYNISSNNHYHDIALLRTAEPVAFSEFIRPICLPISPLWRYNPYVNLTAETAGWGRTENASYSVDKIKSSMPIWSITRCEEQFMTLDINIKGTYHLCAGGAPGVDTCHGDSGGPLILTTQDKQQGIYFMVGIVSFGVNSCGLGGWPGVYTRVGQYIDWIQQNIKA